MNAAHPSSLDRQAEQRAHEPSMEEILASIRRIIADDQAFTSRGGAPADSDESPAEATPEPVTTQKSNVVPGPAPIDSAPGLRGSIDRDVLQTSRPIKDELPFAMPDPVPTPAAPAAVASDTPLVSPQTDAAVSNAFGALVASQFVREAAVMPDLIREMVRPMLKTWLDDNLPVIVERLVRVEIERVARGGR